MKQLLLAILCAVLLSSCGALKRTTAKHGTTIDSSRVNRSLSVEVSKKDSTGEHKKNDIEQKATDNTYKKTTTIKEVYSDEFDFEGPIVVDSSKPGAGIALAKPAKDTAIDSSIKKPVLYTIQPRLKTREIVIQEEGKILENYLRDRTETLAITTREIDSALQMQTDSSSYNYTTNDESDKMKKEPWLPWWGIMIIGIVALLIVYWFFNSKLKLFV